MTCRWAWTTHNLLASYMAVAHQCGYPEVNILLREFPPYSHGLPSGASSGKGLWSPTCRRPQVIMEATTDAATPLNLAQHT